MWKKPPLQLDEPLKEVPAKLEKLARAYYSIYGPPDEWVYQVLARQDLFITKMWWAITILLVVCGVLLHQYGVLAKWWNA